MFHCNASKYIVTKKDIENPCQTSKVEHFGNMVNGLIFSQNTPILDVWKGSEYVLDDEL